MRFVILVDCFKQATEKVTKQFAARMSPLVGLSQNAQRPRVDEETSVGHHVDIDELQRALICT